MNALLWLAAVAVASPVLAEPQALAALRSAAEARGGASLEELSRNHGAPFNGDRAPVPAAARAPNRPVARPPTAAPKREAGSPPRAPEIRKEGSDSSWLLPALGGAGLFVFAVGWAGTLGTVGAPLAGAVGVGLLVYGLLLGARRTQTPVNGAPVGPRP